MQTSVTKEFTFDAAHYLTDYYGKCEKLHGHTYKLQVTVSGELGSNGLLLDFIILKKIVKDTVLSKLDHSNLNDIFTNPTCELIAHWIWNQLEPLRELLKKELANPNLSKEVNQYLNAESTNTKLDTSAFPQNLKLQEVKLWETATSFVTITA